MRFLYDIQGLPCRQLVRMGTAPICKADRAPVVARVGDIPEQCPEGRRIHPRPLAGVSGFKLQLDIEHGQDRLPSTFGVCVLTGHSAQTERATERVSLLARAALDN